MLQNVYEHLAENCYDHIIVTNFEAGFYLDDDQMLLDGFSPAVYDYCYGWEREQLLESNLVENIDFCPGGHHSPVVLVPEWIRNLKTHEVHLCGAFDGECIEDMEIALNFAEINYKRIEKLIV